MEKFWSFLTSCHANSFYPEVIMFALGAYFTARWWFDVETKKSQWVPIIAAFLAMVYFIRPVNIDAGIKCFFLAALHSFFSVGAYSWADHRGWLDKFGDLIDRRIFGNNNQPPAPPSVTTGVAVLAVCMLLGCRPVAPAPHPVEGVTNAGEPVAEVQPIADVPKSDIPAGVKASDVIAVVEQPQPNGTVEKTWIVNSSTFWDRALGKVKIKPYQNRAAARPQPIQDSKFNNQDKSPAPVTVHTMKQSHFWCWLSFGGGLLTLISLIVLGIIKGFFRLNTPSGWISGGWSLIKWIWSLIKSLRGGKS